VGFLCLVMSMQESNTELTQPQKLKRQSKTIWFNTIWFAVAAALLTILNENAHLLQEYLPSWAYLAVLMFNAGINVYLRTITSESVK